MQTPAFTIAPRYADTQHTIPMPTWRNVYASDGAYVDPLCVHDGKWTALLPSQRDIVKDEVLTRAAAQMNGAA